MYLLKNFIDFSIILHHIKKYKVNSLSSFFDNFCNRMCSTSVEDVIRVYRFYTHQSRKAKVGV